MEFTEIATKKSDGQTKPHSPRRTSKSEQLNYLQQWQASGMRQTDFCKQHNINIKTFANWRKRLARDNALASSAPVKGSSSNQSALKQLEPAYLKVTAPNGLSCSIPNNLNLDLILSLVRVLSSCKFN